MLECARIFYNNRAVVKLEKHITSFCRREEKKIHVSSNRKQIGRIRKQRSKSAIILLQQHYELLLTGIDYIVINKIISNEV